MRKNIKILLVFIILFNFFLFPLILPVSAQNPTVDTLKKVGGDSGFADQTNPKDTFATMAGQVVQAFLSLLGIIFLVLMLYGGYNWMISAGDEAKVEKAKNTIRAAIIGIVITAGAFGIWKFIAKFIL